MNDLSLRPKIFVVTPTFNSSETLDKTVQSVLALTKHCDVYYHVQDGGSTDKTLDCLLQWEQRLEDKKSIFFSYKTESDNGIYDAICKGFESFEHVGREDWMCWINSDDQIDINSCKLLSQIDKSHGYIDWVTGNPAAKVSDTRTVYYDRPHSSQVIKTGICDGEEWFFIQQEGTFWRGKLWAIIDKVQFRSYRYAGDYFLWLQFSYKSNLYQSNGATGYFNVRSGQASQTFADEYKREVRDIRMSLNLGRTSQIIQEFDCTRLVLNPQNELEVLNCKIRRIADRDFEYLGGPVKINEHPKITVVTVVFNDAGGLRKTIDSVRALDWLNLEYLVIDGGSLDDTLSVIKDNDDVIDVWVTEPDNGIYDAMNKGVDRASGEYVIFMNAGDEFSGADVLSTVFRSRDYFPDIIYGDRYYVSVDGRRRLQKARASKTVNEKMFYFHQAVFIRLSELRKHRFNSNYHYAGDYHQALMLVQAGCSTEYIPVPICEFYAGGASESELAPALEVVLIQYLHCSKAEFKQSIYLKDLRRRLERIDLESSDRDLISIQEQFPRKKEMPRWFKNLRDFCDEVIELDYAQALQPLVYHFKHSSSEKRLETINDSFKRLLYLRTVSNTSSRYGENDLEFYWSMVREDYSELLANVIGCAPGKYQIDSSKLWTARGDRLNSEALTIYINSKRLRERFAGIDLELKHYMYIISCEMVLLLWNLRKSVPKRAVFFSDMQPFENIVCQFFNMLDIPTVTLQHGLYIEYGEYETDNVVNYLNQPSKVFLAWGKDTADLIKKYHPERKILICGKPVLASSKAEELQSTPKELAKASYITVVFDSTYYDDYNMEMLKIASQYALTENKTINIRFHPRTNRGKFRRLGINYSEGLQIDNSCFTIGHTSSMIVELMAKSLPVFKFYTDAPTLNFPDEVIFTNADQLSQCAERKFDIDFQKIASDFIDCSGKESLGKYKKFFADF